MKLSVVIPVYNDANYLKSCLQAIAAQTVQPYEVIVVDNNCTDDSVGIAKAFNATVVTEAIQGIWPAAARGYDTATGDIIVRCDADTIAPRDWLEKIGASFERDKDQFAVTGPGVFYDTPQPLRFFASFYYMYAYFLLVGSAMANTPLFGSNFALKRSVWMRVRLSVHSTHTDIHDDIDLSYHILSFGSIRYDRKLQVGISGRPLKDWKGSRTRISRGVRSLLLHWATASPRRLYEMRIKRQ